MRRQIVIGNWKAHGDQTFVSELLQQLVAGWSGLHRAEVVVCPTFVHLNESVSELAQSNIVLGAQDASIYGQGAYTGDITADMLHDLGVQYVIVGHSERRRHHFETNTLVAKKFQAVQQVGMVPILCVGESTEERASGVTIEVIDRQLKAVAELCGLENLARAIIAYEPLWAVGTGKTASPEQAQEVHHFIRSELGSAGSKTRLVYGGSVNPSNAADLLSKPDIDGALVGGAALKAKDFIAICQAAE